MTAQIGYTVLVMDRLVFTQLFKSTDAVFNDIDREIESVSQLVE